MLYFFMNHVILIWVEEYALLLESKGHGTIIEWVGFRLSYLTECPYLDMTY